jgi:esterase/lipase superfamily enzyme
LFVHGYNTTFENAARGGIALAQNIGYPGLIVVWSWPSDGWGSSYPFDEETAEWAEAHLEPFEHALNSLAPDLEIDLLAHSLGNRMALFMLERAKTNIDHFRSVVFAAPDVARDIFLQALNRIGTVADLQTLYGSNSDKAMSVSTYYHSSHGQSIPRAGAGGARHTDFQIN